MKIKYYFRVRVGKQNPHLMVEYEGYGGVDFSISNGNTIKFHKGYYDVFKVNEKKSSKRWPKYINCTINEDGLQIEYKGQIKNIDVRTNINRAGDIEIISFNAYE